ncbi:hypothetical protein [Bradyrhizobium sp. WSM1253]|uniref:hypothetical protein n=1 Tax=Bradyrhizobium sp. WSM1253 TaxID=319003 RepID=UPI001FD990DB|nr:hypothetical protein [Bradyrhizobium sp. WSM1253]
MRELGLYLLELLLGANAFGNVDGNDQACFEIVNGADASRRKENVDDAAVPRDHLGLFLEIRFSAEAGLDSPAERIWTLLPGLGHGTSDIAFPETLDGPFVGLLNRECVHAGPEEIGMAIEIEAQIGNALGAQLSEQRHQPAGVELPKRDRHPAEQMAVTLLAPLQLGMGLLLRGDVHDRADERQRSGQKSGEGNRREIVSEQRAGEGQQGQNKATPSPQQNPILYCVDRQQTAPPSTRLYGVGAIQAFERHAKGLPPRRRPVFCLFVGALSKRTKL